MSQGFLGLADDDDVEVFHPITGRSLRNHMPVIRRLQKDQFRLAPRRVHQPRSGRVGHRQPVLELRIDAERVIAIIQELVMQVARRDQQMIEPGLGQCRVAALRERGHVLGKQRVQIGVMDIHDASGKQAAIVPRQPAHGERWWMRCAYPPYNSGFGFRRVDKRSAATEQQRIRLS
jgi:hypothetical protein